MSGVCLCRTGKDTKIGVEGSAFDKMREIPIDLTVVRCCFEYRPVLYNMSLRYPSLRQVVSRSSRVAHCRALQHGESARIAYAAVAHLLDLAAPLIPHELEPPFPLLFCT